jgi:hypothetical protein
MRLGKRRELAGRLPGFALIAAIPTLEMELKKSTHISPTTVNVKVYE